MASKNDVNTTELSAKLNQLEEKVAKLSVQIKDNKQTISELKLIISKRDAQISELELKLGYAQQSLIEKATQKIQECRILIKSGLDEKVISPTVNQIQQHVQTVQEFVEETKELLLAKKAIVDSKILMVKDMVASSPKQGKSLLENALIAPTQTFINQVLDKMAGQTKATRTLIEDKAIYPGKVLYEELVATAQNLPDQALALLETKVLNPVNKAQNKVLEFGKVIYPETVSYVDKTSARIADVYKQTLIEITDQIKKSPFWSGGNSIKTSY